MGTQVSPVGMLWNLTAILIFLSINGHHMFFSTLVESFEWLKPGTATLTKATFEGLMQGASHMFVLAVKIMAPAGAALFFTHVAMGIVAKTVPQIPIMISACRSPLGWPDFCRVIPGVSDAVDDHEF